MRAGVSSAHSRASGQPAAGSPPSPARADETITVAGAALVADPAGALYWPDEQALVIADLHLEKGSAFAARGVLLPPYDTATTLARLAGRIERYAPRLVIALGDSFHDGGGPLRMSAADRAALTRLQRGRDWVWIAGNHDPDPADGIGGRFATTLAFAPLTFRHEPAAGALRRRGRRPSASGRAGRPARPRGQPALFRRRRQAPGHAGLRRLCRRPQCARPRDHAVVRRPRLHGAHAGRAPPLCHRRRTLLAGLKVSRAGTPRWRSSRSRAPSSPSPDRRARRDRARR